MNRFAPNISTAELILLRVAGEPIDVLEPVLNEKNIEIQYELLQQIIRKSVVLNALPFSSLVFYDSVLKFLETPVAQFRKKERQVARKLLQYLTRASVKNSPFYTLGQVGFTTLNSQILQYKTTQQVIYNDEIEQLIHESCISNSFYAFMLNPTLTLDEGQTLFTFFMDQAGHEAILELETNSFLLDLYQNRLLKNQKIVSPFRLADEYAPYDPVEQKEIMTYLHNLVDMGFLLVVKESLAADMFPIDAVNAENLKQLAIQIEEQFGLLPCKIESLIYIDQLFVVEKFELQKEQFQSALDQIRNLFFNANFYVEIEKNHDFFNSIYSQLIENQSITILEIYAQYCTQNVEFKSKMIILNCDFHDLFEVENRDEQTVLLQNKKTDLIGFEHNNPTSYTLFMNMMQTDKQQVFVLNAIGAGNSKFYGRFLNFFSEKPIIADVNDQFLVENVDSTLFTANNKVRYFPNRITTPANVRGEKGEILINDLLIKKENGELILWHKPTKKRVKILDLGLMHPKGRTPLFQLLQYFEEERISFSSIKTLIIKELEVELDLGVQFCPRVYLSENLVLQRKRWVIDCKLVSITELPKLLEKYNIPNKVFVVFNPRNDQSDDPNDYYKPQYIQFDSPLSLENWKVGTKKANLYILIEEAFPDSDNFPTINDECRAVELVKEIVI